MKYLFTLLALFYLATPLIGQMDYQYDTYKAHRASQKMLEVADGKMAYLDLGKGDPILLVHGVPTSSWLYRKVIDELLKDGYRVIAPDLLGYGNSDKPKGFDIYSAENQAKRLLALMDHLGIQEWSHVMHDVGGLWSFQMMDMAHERIKNLVILNTIVYEEGFNPPMRFEEGAWAKFYTKMYKWALTGGLMMNATLKNGLSKGIKLTKAEKKGYLKPMREGGNWALYSFFTQTCLAVPDHQPILDKLDAPVMVIWGMKDEILVGDQQIPILQKKLSLGDNAIHPLTDAKHFIQEEKPKEIADYISSFVK